MYIFFAQLLNLSRPHFPMFAQPAGQTLLSPDDGFLLKCGPISHGWSDRAEIWCQHRSTTPVIRPNILARVDISFGRYHCFSLKCEMPRTL